MAALRCIDSVMSSNERKQIAIPSESISFITPELVWVYFVVGAQINLRENPPPFSSSSRPANMPLKSVA
jgi:hypothetical protein